MVVFKPCCADETLMAVRLALWVALCKCTVFASLQLYEARSGLDWSIASQCACLAAHRPCWDVASTRAC